MNFRKLFIAAVILNVALAACAYWFWRASRPTAVAQQTQEPQEHPAMEGFTTNPSPDGAPPVLMPVELSPERMQSIGVRTGRVEYKSISSDIRATGTVEVDERRVAYVQSRYAGWIKDVFVDATYQLVNKGQPLFTIYSPELVASEQEYLLAKANAKRLSQSSVQGVASGAETMLRAARERLLQWNLSDEDIAKLEASDKPLTNFAFNSPVSGYVIERTALPNTYVQPEMRLYTIADLSSVWVEAQVFQEDVGKLKPGNPSEITVDAYPNRTFRAHVEQILPQVDTTTRTLRVRLSVENLKLLLKPGMFVNVRLMAALGRQLFVPATAVLESGLKQVVFLARGQGRFDPQTVQLGTRTGDGFVVLAGLTAGDEVATSANFLIDSESQLQAAAGAYVPPPPGAGTGMNGSTQPTAELTVSPSPPHKGSNNLGLKLTSADGKPITDASVTVQFFMAAMPEMGMAEMKNVARLRDQGNGNYAGPIELGSGGTWQVTISVSQQGKVLLTKRMNVSATGGR